jgi:hypothetical protein
LIKIYATMSLAPNVAEKNRTKGVARAAESGEAVTVLLGEVVAYIIIPAFF